VKTDAYTFASLVDGQIEALPNDQYIRRQGQAKRLLEELLPLSRLGLRLKQPGLKVEVEAFEDSGAADGVIRVAGFWSASFDVQVTYAGYGYEDALRAELLVQRGHTPAAGPIARDKATAMIDARVAAIDADEYIERLAEATLDRLIDKCQKAYQPGTVLIISFDEVKLHGHQSWARLISLLDAKGGMSGSPFSHVYLFNAATNVLYDIA
jgi:hypothetical protein